MCVKIFLVICSLLSVFVDSTYFDQSQSGELNVQVDLKDLQIIALMKGGKEEYVDYDYAYDYSEMTIKPQNRTTPRPLNVTSTTAAAELDGVKDNVTVTTTVIPESTTVQTANSETVRVTLDPASDYNSTIKNTVSNVTEPTLVSHNTTVISTPIHNSTVICKKGFILNDKGDCELKLQATGNALLKLVKLSQKLKLRRETKSGDPGQ